MTSTLRQKINDYAGKVPYVGNALTTEIKWSGMLAGVLTAGMLYSSMARAEPYVDTRSSLVKRESGQVCLDTDRIEFHLSNNLYDKIFGERATQALAKILLRRGYAPSEGEIIPSTSYRGILERGQHDDKTIPHLFLTANHQPSQYSIDLSVRDVQGSPVYLDQIVFSLKAGGQGFDGQKSRAMIENAIPPSCAALRDGRVKPSTAIPASTESKECICPPVPVCEPKGEKQSWRTPESPRDYTSPSAALEQKCFNVGVLAVLENEFPHRQEFLLNDTEQKVHTALINYLTQEAGYAGVDFVRKSVPSVISLPGEHLRIRHPEMPFTGYAVGAFGIEARDGGTILENSTQRYNEAMVAASFRTAGIPPRCPRKTAAKAR